MGKKAGLIDEIHVLRRQLPGRRARMRIISAIFCPIDYSESLANVSTRTGDTRVFIKTRVLLG
jgi:hypothetical protein